MAEQFNQSPAPTKTEFDSLNNNKQNKTDNTLVTTAKTVVGAVNELNTKISDYTDVNGNVKSINNPNFNDLKTSGRYFTTGTGTNGPLASVLGHLDVGNYYGFVKQVFTQYASNRTFVRINDGSSWSTWEELALNSNLTNKTKVYTTDVNTKALLDSWLVSTLNAISFDDQCKIAFFGVSDISGMSGGSRYMGTLYKNTTNYGVAVVYHHTGAMFVAGISNGTVGWTKVI